MMKFGFVQEEMAFICEMCMESGVGMFCNSLRMSLICGHKRLLKVLMELVGLPHLVLFGV